MSQGKCYQCNNCQEKYIVCTGSGMMFPTIYKETLDDAIQGEYGAEWKQLIQSDKYMDINAELGLYICGCGNWEVEKDLSLYAPVSESVIKTHRFGEKKVEELGYVPYVMQSERDSYYQLVKVYEHKCGKCGNIMNKVNEKYIGSLRCPKCKTINNPLGNINWD